jgi:alpha-aminoadipic semialdehyde synthase
MQFNNPNHLVSIGISRETKSIWERRTPLTPIDCKKLVDSKITVIVQPSHKRCFTDNEYEDVGCIVQEDLSQCKVILCVQEVEENNLLANKTYMFFSHSISGQFLKMPLIRKINDLKVRLIDYECIREIISKDSIQNSIGRRLITFENISGLAGTVNIIKAVGDLLLSREISTPFLFTKFSNMYPTLESACDSLKLMGQYIIKQELPDEISPFIFGIIGNGKLSQGVQQSLNLLPHLELTPEQLIEGNYEKHKNLIYYVIFSNNHIFSHVNNSNYDNAEFANSPENFNCFFYDKFFKHITIIINTMSWERRYPKLLTKNNLKNHNESQKTKLLGISDLSGSLNGAIELIDEMSSVKKQYFIYDTNSSKKIKEFDETLQIIVYQAYSENLAFAIDMSIQFSAALLPFINILVTSEYPCELDQDSLSEELKIATIASNGSLTKKYMNLFQSSLENEKILKTRHIRTSLNHANHVSLKLKGHIVIKGLLKKLVYNINKYAIDFDIIHLKIGENNEDESLLYIDLFSESSDILTIFLIELKSQCNISCCECYILKHNIVTKCTNESKMKDLFFGNKESVNKIY